jgi:hypothetical protein
VNLKLDLNTAEFRMAAQRAVRELGANAEMLIKEEARFAIRDFVKVTPPFAAGAYNKSMGSAADREAGEGAVKRDIRQIAVPITPKFLGWVTERFGSHNVSVSLIRKGTKDKYQVAFTRVAPTIGELASIHQSKRNRYGRVAKNARPESKAAAPTPVLLAYAKQMIARIGAEKNVFGTAAARLGLRLPSWVSRRGMKGAGSYREGMGPSFFIEISGRSQRPQAPSDLAYVVKKRGEILAKEVQRMATSFARTGKILTRRKSFNTSE